VIVLVLVDAHGKAITSWTRTQAVIMAFIAWRNSAHTNDGTRKESSLWRHVNGWRGFVRGATSMGGAATHIHSNTVHQGNDRWIDGQRQGRLRRQFSMFQGTTITRASLGVLSAQVGPKNDKPTLTNISVLLENDAVAMID
jgi:hypothetical protein